MRVRRLPYIPSLIRLGEIVRLDTFMEDQDGESPLEHFLVAPEPAEDHNQIVNEELFQVIEPGEERVIIVLKSEDYTHESIASIMGVTESHVRAVLARVRERITDQASR